MARRPVRPPRRPGRLRGALLTTAVAAGTAALVAGAVPATAGPAAPATNSGAATGAVVVDSARPAAAPAAAAVRASTGPTVNLFEWNWPSIAKECTTVLGPAGYAAVQVAPPQDSVSRTETTAPTPLHPWWEVYQPVDYDLTSKMGDEAAFRSMVSTCRAAGVGVIADVVVNHMTGQGDVSYGGVHYTKYSYPGLYSPSDFHGPTGACPSADGGIDDFNNIAQVTRCELVGLSDLRTETPKVQATLASYLDKLLGYGVVGFRVDAAKHVPEADLRAIGARLHTTVDGTAPYVALEVPPGSPGVLAPAAYTDTASVLGFDFASQVQAAFRSYPAGAAGNITSLRGLGPDTGLVPSDRSLAFVENHDTERNGSTLSYKDGATNRLATEFMLAQPYGRPQVYSSFTFTGSDDAPPSNAAGYVTDAVCGPLWTCLHRDPGVLGMVRFADTVGTAPQANWTDDGVNAIAFSRGSRGWVALNNAATATRPMTAQTGLAPGRYCDLVTGGVRGSACAGTTVTVRADGTVSGPLPAKGAVAITGDTRLG